MFYFTKRHYYKTQLQKIYAFASIRDVQVFPRWCKSGYFHSNRTHCYIEIGTRNSFVNQIYILLHELGHYEDFSNNRQIWLRDSDDITLFELMGDNTISLKLRINREIRAWKNAKRIAKLLDIPINEHYYKVRREGMRSYFKKYVRVKEKFSV